MNKNSKIKNSVSEKWMLVYQALPEDGSPIRFKQLIGVFKELHVSMSRATICAALHYFCDTGWITRVEKSKKTVLYSRAKPNEKGINTILNMRTPLIISKIAAVIANVPPSYYKDELLDLKKANKDDALFKCQTVILNQYLILIDTHLQYMLMEQVKKPNAEQLRNDIFLYLIPKVRELISMFKDVGLDERTLPLLSMTERRPFTDVELNLWHSEEEYKQEQAVFEKWIKNPYPDSEK